MLENKLFIRPIHTNTFKREFDLDAEERAGVRENLFITIDGTIMAVDRDKVRPHLDRKEVKDVRMGRVKPPREFELKTEDDFWYIMAHFVELDQD